MALTPVKALLFLLGGTTAAGTTAYVAGVFDPYFDRPAEVSAADPVDPAGQKVAELPPASLIEEPAVPAADDKGDKPKADAPAVEPPAVAAPAAEPTPPPAEDAAAPEAPEAPAVEKPADAAAASEQPPPPVEPAPAPTPAPAEAAVAPDAPPPAEVNPEAEQEIAALPADQAAPQQPEAPVVVAPSFDIVRVEADGSIVIAGRAAANATVEAVIGSRVIGSTVAGADGNFAIVLDEPLQPGDYQIVLRSTSPGNIVATSVETAVVSIPESKDGQVLALVEEPGKPAELITVPEPKAPADDPAAAGDATTPPAESGAADVAKPQETVAPPADGAEPPAQEPAVAGTEPAATPDGQPPASGGEVAAADPQPPETDPAAPKPDDQVAAADPAPAPAQEAPKPEATIRVAVEAVEIEGRRIFVAGSADPGRLVRAYANDLLLGDARTSAAGRFLVEAERDLAVGDYIIRVDALGPDGAKVVARAAVPFEREPGENLAAVAPPPGPEQPADAGAATDAKPPEMPVEAPGAAAAADPDTEKADRLPDAEAQAPEPASPPDDEAVPATPPVSAAAEPAAPPVADEAMMEPSAPSAADEGAAEPAPAVAETVPPAAEPPAPDVSEGVVVAVPRPEADTEAPAAPEMLAPKLRSVDSAVIIRRGDTLWRISRRVYGRGVRYSTIYLANQEQIRDPDLIMPGQVFKVPDRTAEGEAADMTGMGDQAMPAPTVQQ